MAIYLSNQDVDRLLTMKGCMKSIEGIYKELAIGDAVYRHRIDVFVPPGKKNSYFRWGTMEGGSRKCGFAILDFSSATTDVQVRYVDHRGQDSKPPECFGVPPGRASPDQGPHAPS